MLAGSFPFPLPSAETLIASELYPSPVEDDSVVLEAETMMMTMLIILAPLFAPPLVKDDQKDFLSAYVSVVFQSITTLLLLTATLPNSNSVASVAVAAAAVAVSICHYHRRRRRRRLRCW